MKIAVIILISISVCLALPTHPRRKLLKREISSASDNGSKNNLETSTVNPPLAASKGSNSVIQEVSPSTSTPNSAASKLATITVEQHSIGNANNIPDVNNSPLILQSRIFPLIDTTAFYNNARKGNVSVNRQDIIFEVNNPFPISDSRSTQFDITEPLLHGDEFKVRVLDFPTRPEAPRFSQFFSGSPVQQIGQQTPSRFFADNLQYGDGISRDQIFLNNFQNEWTGHQPTYFNNFFSGAPEITDPFQQRQPIPILNQDYFGGSSNYPISGIYPIQPIGGIEQFPIFGGGSPIPVISDVGSVSQGFDFFQPQPIGLTDEKVDPDKDSVTIEALGKAKVTLKTSEVAAKKVDAATESKEN